MLPVILEPPIEAAATQCDDGVCAADSPEHAGSFKPCSDDGLATSFHHTGANEESFLTKLWVAHPAGIGCEVFSLFQDLRRQVGTGVGVFSGNLP